MKVVILGAGITGITAAYVLAMRGHEVEVIEQEPAAALQTSFSNGAQLSYSHAEPWANPGVFSQLSKWMFRDDAPLVLRPRADLAMMKWMLQFLTNCTPSKARENCERMMRIGLYSKQKMAQIRRDTEIEFDFLPNGILHVFSDQKAYAAAIKQADFQETLGCKEHVFTRNQCLEKEPALAFAHKNIIGGIFSDIDESGDIHKFTQNLAAFCEEKFGVSISYDTRVLKLNAEGGMINAVTTSRGDVRADAYVMCLGAYSPILLSTVGVNVPIYPMKGYSITVPAWDGAPTVSITDDEKKVVFSRLGDRVRAAGTAEFAGYNTEIREARIKQMTDTLKDLFPAADTTALQKWACIRPQTPDGPPLIGRTTLANLYLNTGHGTLGWTHGAGSAYLLADVMEQREPEIRLSGFEMSRYRR